MFILIRSFLMKKTLKEFSQKNEDFGKEVEEE